MAMPRPDPREPDPRHLPPPRLVRLYADARDRGEAERMAVVWKALCVKTIDRVRGLVQGFHFPNTNEGFPPDRVDDAVQEAFLLVQGKVGKLRGSTEGEYYAALAQWVWNACMDYGRRELRHDVGIGGSLDEPGFEGETDRSRFDAELDAEAAHREDERLDTEETEAGLAHGMELVAWAIPQIENENYRVVLEMTFFERLSGEDIAQRLGITPDNVYQRRSRGLRKLQEILRDRRP
jgi:RNA polymerase sigma factor (sigma-70 family)